jgi:uncharacterized damage-inducible protein DinB
VSEVSSLFVKACRETLGTWHGRIEKCLDQLTPEQLWWRGHDSNNAIGNLVLHLSGNVRQWIVAGVGGAADIRQRDAEFDCREPLPVAEIREKLAATVREADAVMARLTEEDLQGRRKIQVYDVTVLEAVQHVAEHFAMHAGQILYATKLLTGTDLGFYSFLKKKQS